LSGPAPGAAGDRATGALAPAAGGVRLARAATLLAVTTVASRGLGLVREVIVAALFGASDAKAAYVIGYYVPFFVQRLLIGGTLSIVLIPTLADLIARRDEAELGRVTSYLFTAVLVLGVVMVVAGQLLAPSLIRLAAPGFAERPGQLELTISLTRVNFLSMFFLALAVFATAYLQALQRFVVPSLAPLIFNIVTIAGTVWLGPRMGIMGLAVAWIAGAAAQFFVQAPALSRLGFQYRIAFAWDHPAVRRVGRLALPAMFGLAIVEINAYVGRFFASLLPAAPGVNAVAALDYAFQVVQAPVGILAISVATVLFPGMSQIAASGDRDRLSETTSLGLRSLVFLVLPISAALILFSIPFVQLIFQRGQFGPAATTEVAGCLAAYAVGLVPMAAYYVITRTFYALHDMRTPVMIGLVAVVLNAILDYVLMRVMGVAGIALATALVTFVNVSLLMGAVGRRVGGLDGRRIALSAFRVIVAAAVAFGVALVLVHFIPVNPAARGLERLLVLGAAMGVAAVVYLAVCAVLRVEELSFLKDLVRRR
jgi:putative peptidoglycan lipid II flippase